MKRVLSLLLVVCVLLSLVACAPDQPDASTGTPTNTESVPTEPTNTDPAPTDPAATDPTVTDPTVTDPTVTNPPATNPPATEPPATNPPATEPPATNPPATEPPATNPPATEPPATDPPATQPPVTEPATEILKGTPTVDGKLDDIYKSSFTVKIDNKTAPVLMAKDDTDDLKATVYFLHDGEYLYICGVVTGDSAIVDAAAKGWACDGIDMWFLLPEQPLRTKVTLDAFAQPYGEVLKFGYQEDKHNLDVNKITKAATRGKTSYIVEAKLPVPYYLASQNNIALNVQLNNVYDADVNKNVNGSKHGFYGKQYSQPGAELDAVIVKLSNEAATVIPDSGNSGNSGGTKPPATEPPATEPPATEPPATQPPATEPPATEPPVTNPPATEPPVTEPPATDPGEKTDYVSVQSNGAIDKYVDTKIENDVNGSPMMHDGKTHAQRVIAADGFCYAPGSNATILFCAGDWYTYQFTVGQAGTYVFGVCAATDRDTPFVIYVDGMAAGTGIFNEAVTDPQYGTGGYDIFNDSNLLKLTLSAGTHTIKVAVEELKNHNVYVKNFWLKAEGSTGGSTGGNTGNTGNSGTTNPPATVPGDSSAQSIISAAQSAEQLKNTTSNAVWKELYVSPTGSDSNDGSKSKPFATLYAANEAVKALRSQMQGDIVIHIAGGYYSMSQPLVIGVDGGGANGYSVIYRGDSSNKPVLSGGVQITGWTQNGNIWSAPCNVADTRTLYINDNPAVRARSEYLYSVASMDATGVLVKTSLPQLSKPQELELVFDSEWMHHRLAVSGINYGSNQATLVMDQPYWSGVLSIISYNVNYPNVNKGFYLENAIELLDRPGEFYFDKTAKRIYYYPFSDEDMTTAQCYVGVTEGLLQVKGTDKNTRVTGLAFENIQFKYGAWNEVSKTGMLSNQADNLRETKNPTAMMQMPSQVRVECADNIAFRGCVFACLGSTALSMPNAVSNAVIDGNVFKDISGLAISVGHFKHDKNIKADQARPTKIDITNNVIRRIGLEYRCAPAINAYYVSYVRIMHNDIQDVPYTGISLGWGWGQDIKECTNNLIAYNKIVNVTNPTHDGAHIYTLSPNYTTYINNNWCVGSGDIRGGIYADEGSAHMYIFHNVVEDMNRNWLFARSGVNISDIHVFQNYSDTSTAVSDAAKLSDHTVVTNGNWPAAAKSIMNSAGVLAAYKGLLTGVDAPSWRTNFVTTVPNQY